MISRYSRLLLLGGATLSVAMWSSCSSSTTPASGGSTITSAAGGLAATSTTLKRDTPNLKDNNSTAFNSYMRRGTHDLLGFLFPNAMATSYTAFGSDWTTAMLPDLYGNSNESIQNYLGQTIDPDFLNKNQSATGIAGRYLNALFETCGMMAVLSASCGTDSDGLPSVGSCTSSLSLSSITAGGTFEGCPVPENFNAGGGGSLPLSVTVAAVTGNATYNKKITITGAPVGDATGVMTIYAKLNPTTGAFNFESISPGDNVTNNTACGGSRYLLAVNGSVTQFEYTSLTIGSDISAGCSPDREGNPNTTSHEDYYRIHIDTGTNVAYMLGSEPTNGFSTGETFLLSGEPSNLAAGDGSVAVSVWANRTGTIPNGATTYDSQSADACVSQSDGSITTDGSLSCDITGIDVVTAQTMLSARSTTDFSATTDPISANPSPSTIGWTSGRNFATASTTN